MKPGKTGQGQEPIEVPGKPLAAPSSRSLTPFKQPQDYYDDTIDFGVRFVAQEARTVPLHAHRNIQISIPLGDTHLDVKWQTTAGNFQQSSAQRGQVIIIPPNQQHAVAWRKRAYFVNLHMNADIASEQRSIFLHHILRFGAAHTIEDPFLAALGENLILVAGNGRLDSSFLRSLHMLVEAHVIGRSLLTGLQKKEVAVDCRPHGESEQTEKPGASGSTPADFPLLSSDPVMGISGKGLTPWQLKKIIKLIDGEIDRDRSVAELAATVNLSTGHFSRAFHKSTGLSPRQWIIHRRVEFAARRLANTNDALADIAKSCGFSDQSHFTRRFTKIVGKSPAAWRRENGPR